MSKEAAKAERQASVETNDIVISRSGTLGLSIAVPSELAGAIFGSYFIRVRPKAGLNPQFLALYMNARVGQIQVEQANTGGIQTNLTIPVMEAFRIALPPKEIQDEIVRKVYKSFQTQDGSKHLLETAKRGIELAIEQDEQTALAWIDEQQRKQL
ncbi:MAG: restriction endonuclease subunit S [Acidobacteria bacterium]|nr:restriction endonuclease subunit S [Acidobacteriota bacterium]